MEVSEQLVADMRLAAPRLCAQLQAQRMEPQLCPCLEVCTMRGPGDPAEIALGRLNKLKDDATFEDQ